MFSRFQQAGIMHRSTLLNNTTFNLLLWCASLVIQNNLKLPFHDLPRTSLLYGVNARLSAT
jgi:hypothetical protein